MRWLLAGALLAVVLAVPAVAKVSFPYDLTFSGGTVDGTFGGVPVTGTYTGTDSGTFTLFVDGAVFAEGTYACDSTGCTFTGTELLGESTSFTFTSTSLSDPASGDLTGLFATHGAWVSSVAHWSQVNLTTMTVGQVVRTAASIQGQSKKQTSPASLLNGSEPSQRNSGAAIREQRTKHRSPGSTLIGREHRSLGKGHDKASVQRGTQHASQAPGLSREHGGRGKGPKEK